MKKLEIDNLVDNNNSDVDLEDLINLLKENKIYPHFLNENELTEYDIRFLKLKYKNIKKIKNTEGRNDGNI